ELIQAEVNIERSGIIAIAIELVGDFIAGPLLPIGPDIGVIFGLGFFLAQQREDLLERFVFLAEVLQRQREAKAHFGLVGRIRKAREEVLRLCDRFVVVAGGLQRTDEAELNFV